jgi:hypothetical protein
MDMTGSNIMMGDPYGYNNLQYMQQVIEQISQ